MEMLSDDGGCKREREGGRKQGEYRDRGGDHQVSPNKTRRTRKRGGCFSLSIIFSLSFFFILNYTQTLPLSAWSMNVLISLTESHFMANN